MWYIGKRPCCARGLNARLRGILGYQERLEVIQQYDDAFKAEAGDEFDSE